MADTDINRPILDDDNPRHQEIIIRLEQAIHSLRAIHALSKSTDSNEEIAEHILTAIGDMARASAKGIDACIDRLSGEPIGNFAGEFQAY